MSAGTEWIAALREGDDVVQEAPLRMLKVVRATRTMVVCAPPDWPTAEVRFYVKNGRKVGGSSYRNVISPADSEGKRRVRHAELLQWGRYHAGREIEKLHPEAIGQVRAFINQLKKDAAP